MIRKKAYIGYDLGDGETITDMVALDKDQINQSIQIHFDDMTMPDNNTPGMAIPTVYGYCGDKIVFASTILDDPEMVKDVRVNFKRRPSDLIQKISEDRKKGLTEVLESSWPDKQQYPELYTDEMLQFSEAVITFTNAVFSQEKYQQKITDASFNCDEIVFCVGHPTKWNSFDVAIYKGILRRSILGSKKYVNKSTSLVLAAESRAAFLHIKNQGKTDALPKGTVALLIDVGSSTVDITAMTADSRNYVYNSGNNYLGARCVDYAIQKWYEDQLKKDPESWGKHLTLMKYNPSMEKSLTLACRMAKERCYSISNASAKIPEDFGAKIRITADDIDNLIATIPAAPLLKARISLPIEVERSMGNRSYAAIFREFIENEKKVLDKSKVQVGRVILTGSASQMAFVQRIVRDVFGKTQILGDMNPSRSISTGLALVGPFDEKSKDFEEEIIKLLDQEVPAIVSKNIEQLANSVSPIIQKCIEQIIKSDFKMWCEGKIKTLADMSAKIKLDCSEKNLTVALKNNPEYLKTVEAWITNNVSQDIALRMKGICQRYQVTNLSVDDLNVMKVPGVIVGPIVVDPMSNLMSILNTVVSIVAGVIVAVMLPTILVILTVLIAEISATIGLLILAALAAMPVGGWEILALIAGVSIAFLVARGLGALKEIILSKMQTFNLPLWVRNKVSEEKIKSKIAQQDLASSIRSAILQDDAKKQIVKEVVDNLRVQVEKRAEEIKYVIQSS